MRLEDDRRPTKPHVVVVGAGFAGLHAARALARAPVEVTVVDRAGHHLFQPLLYQVATAGLSGPEIAVPIRSVLRRQENAHVLLAEVRSIDVESRVVHTDGPDLHYDTLVLAPGARHAYHGHADWETNAPGLKSLEDALEIRRRVLHAYESAEWETDEALREAWLTFVVVGAGPTGVELAGALAEVARLTLAHDFRSANPRAAKVILVEAAPRMLAAYPQPLADYALNYLRRMGVEVRLATPVEDVTAEGLRLNGAWVPCRTVLWAAGAVASPLGSDMKVPLAAGRRIPVAPDLSIPDHPEVFVAGDMAAFAMPNGRFLPGLAPVALQQGRWAGDNIARRLAGKPTRPFRYHDKGSLSTIGRRVAVGQLGKISVRGTLAWFLWTFIHIAYLIGFENRLLVLVRWAWSYLTFSRGARVIFEPWRPRGIEVEAARQRRDSA